MILVVEGIDGCGKTSVVAATVRALVKLQDKLLPRPLAFPNRSSFTGQVIDAHLKALPGAPGWLDPYTHQALQVVNRLERLPELTDPAWVNVLSRYTPSAFVYGVLDGVNQAWLRRVTAALPSPDLCVHLSVEPKVAWGRMHERGVTSDAYERRGLEWFEKAEELYRKMWATHMPCTWPTVDATLKTPDVLGTEIAKMFVAKFITP